ncbi:hypothetical protein [Pelagicoccus sp. SDUM812002]|uniref:hypothetical protein n=1 Tax=Pelagicoccus sp. SDUM812002 TaxID=3041266 RepID=UPI00280C9501|nr:hypothetical protein [Pelagicoccus sp. SDUM812002]MDQ8184044.1 hypothetical protein [Pelagicoccus sp. SDUM812002]
MKETIQEQSHLSHAKLRRELYPVALRIRDRERIQIRTKAFLKAFAACALAASIAYLFPSLSDFAAIVGILATTLFLVLSYRRENHIGIDYLEAARAIEKKNPNLNQSLITAVQQNLAGDSGFFSTQVINQALASESVPEWENIGKPDSLKGALSHIGALSILAFSLYACFQASKWSDSINEEFAQSPEVASSVLIEPGNIEIQRGSSIVVTARFEGRLPDGVELELVPSNTEASSTIRMAQSLSDPVFAYSLQGIEETIAYRIRYRDSVSETHHISVYDLPKLVTADAVLKFPEYTGWKSRKVMDTLRLSAIEGTRLSYTFNTNKPVQDAYLENKRGERVSLNPNNEYKTQFLLESVLNRSESYTLHLQDEAGRFNEYPAEIQIDSIENKRPNLRVESPRGDLRVSPLEEVLFSGNVSDDFGLLDYGIGFAFSGEEPNSFSLANEKAAPDTFEDELNYLLNLEEHSVQPKDIFSWYLWATDFGPDGAVRRTTGDLYFADVRNFDEIFREQDQGGGGQGETSEQGMELLEKQRRIAISLFRIKNAATDAESESDNLDVVQLSQVEALEELQQLVPQLREASSRQYASEAQRFMEGVDVGLSQAIDRPSLEPLELAWSDAQSAYDKLVKLGDDEFNVSRSQNSQQGGGGGPSRNQAQINELDFRTEDSRYETASQAQALTSPDERKDLELISKLSELSRRQDDINERLQEMQGELANAKSEEERQRIERELKRLEEEQQQMLADADEAIRQAGNRQSTRQVREQLEQARENMREAKEELEDGQVSQALASGTRARNTLDQSRDQMREANSSEFSEALREARSQAKQLSETQEQLEQQIDDFVKTSRGKLDDTEERESLAQDIEQQSRELKSLLDQVREIAEAAENVEPGLFRDLYQILRDNNTSRYEERYDESSLYVRQGFIDEARGGQRGLSESIEQLSESISDAAESVLGNEAATMQFAQSEIESLNQQLESERQSQNQSQAQSQGQPQSQSEGQPSGQSQQANNTQPQRGGSGGGSTPNLGEQLRDAFSDFEQAQQGPLTGGSFSEWIDRLNTVESLLEEPNVRARVSEARETAESMRRDFKRHGELPQWDMIEGQITDPLNEVRAWLAEELIRTQGSDTLQAIDRDPVPEEYNNIVRSYYESLGDD